MGIVRQEAAALLFCVSDIGTWRYRPHVRRPDIRAFSVHSIYISQSFFGVGVIVID